MPPRVERQSSLSLLAEYDDFLTDSLVDRLHYWTTIRKIKSTYHPYRRISTNDILDIIVQDVVKGKNTKVALQRFLSLRGVKQYLKIGSQGGNEPVDFVKQVQTGPGLLGPDTDRGYNYRHARRYISIYQPDAGFEVASTNRFDPAKPEACVLARRSLQRGDSIKYLTGVMVKMSDSEEESFSEGQSDFSIIYSSRVGAMSLLLGPARFINHDCEPNSKFITTNKENVTLWVQKDVELGDEITVKYADDYFGEGNRECLCRTCELLTRNGWASGAAPTASSQFDEDGSEIQQVAGGGFILARRSKRKKSFNNSYASDAIHESKKPRIPEKYSSSVLSPPESIRGASADLRSASPLLTDAGSKSSSSTPPPPGVMGPKTPPGTDGAVTPIDSGGDAGEPVFLRVASEGRLEDNHKLASSPPSNLLSQTMAERTTLTLANAGGEAAAHQDLEAPRAGTVPEIIVNRNSGKHSWAGGEHPPEADNVATHPQASWEDEFSDFTELDDSDFDDDTQTIKMERVEEKRRLAQAKQKSLARRRQSKKEQSAVHRIQPRVPGDYLSHNKDSVSCICSDCQQPFVHGDKFFIPTACSRCERHSKIYGFVWPKTTRGKNDTEAQIEDHRVIRRYITPGEHKRRLQALPISTASGKSTGASSVRSEDPNIAIKAPASGSQRAVRAAMRARSSPPTGS